ncbi:AAA family ATPase [Acinetobacter haemolyticus]|uniref:AAA family ATPase n=1 Tax=Acinetobacter haemolyticus TaxID=29430 RepID=UPI003F54F9BF
MINYISIENFRCFKQSKFKDFSHINLIGGLNNSGKSALLEAILLLLSPQLETIILLNKYRNEIVTKKILLIKLGIICFLMLIKKNLLS